MLTPWEHFKSMLWGALFGLTIFIIVSVPMILIHCLFHPFSSR
jgi:hypothetical protein